MRRVNAFPDNLEGQLPKSTEEMWNAHLTRIGSTKDQIKAFFDKLEIERWSIYACCLRLDQDENLKAWGGYASSSNTVAVVFKFNPLMSSLSPKDSAVSKFDLRSGMIRYVDRSYEGFPTYNGYFPFMFKDSCYTWENEFRILKEQPAPGNDLVKAILEGRANPESTSLGIFVDVPLNLIVDRAVVHPNASLEFYQEIKKRVELLGYNWPVELSRLRTA